MRYKIYLALFYIFTLYSCIAKKADISELYYTEYLNLMKEYIFISSENIENYVIEQSNIRDSIRLQDMKKELSTWLSFKTSNFLEMNVRKVPIKSKITFELYISLFSPGRLEFIELGRLQYDWIDNIKTKMKEYFQIDISNINLDIIHIKNSKMLKTIFEESVRKMDNNPNFIIYDSNK